MQREETHRLKAGSKIKLSKTQEVEEKLITWQHFALCQIYEPHSFIGACVIRCLDDPWNVGQTHLGALLHPWVLRGSVRAPFLCL